jgi:ferric-dicitrate binding protein FerR (iron transport regulator)
MDPDLERAVVEIREEAIDPAVVEAAVARVWARLAESAHPAHIRDCAGFQALLPEYRAGRLSEARTLLVKDHLHACVACRRAFEGKVVELAAPPAVRRPIPIYARLAMAAAVLAAAGVGVWIAVDRLGTGTTRPRVESVSGNLYEITDAGILPMAAGQDLPDGVEIRTAKDSFAVLRLRDGSRVELRERSDFSASESGRDLSLRLGRGSVIVEAAKRRSGHLYVNTADCRVAVTGTVFGVNAGMKGSRILVIQGEVHVAQENQEKVLRPGEEAVTGPSLEPGPARDDFSRDLDRLVRGLPPAAVPRISPLLARAPASTIFFMSIPRGGGFLDQSQEMLRRKMAQNPELRQAMAGRLPEMDSVLVKLRTARAYLGNEIAILAFAGPDGKERGPVFLTAPADPGLADILRKELGPSAVVVSRPGLVAFSPERGVMDAFAPALDAAPNAFQSSPCFQRIAESQLVRISLVACANLDRQAPGGMRYLTAELMIAGSPSESRATIGFAGPRTGIAGWLAAPAPMGSLDYVSPEASFVAAFAVNDPAAVVDDLLGLFHRAPASEMAPEELRQEAAALGGEFALALDGPVFPVPSWKLAIEVYDPARFQAAIQKQVEIYNRETVKSGGKPLRTSQETVSGRVYYMIAGADPNPLTEVHYTYASGYAIAGPSRAVVNNALQVKSAGTSITRSAKFIAVTPRDRYMNFSALIYQNLGTTLAPLAGLLGALGNMRGGPPGGMPDLSNIQPSFVAAYGEPDRITIAATGTPLGIGPAALEGGSLAGLATSLPALGQLLGTGKPRPAFR